MPTEDAVGKLWKPDTTVACDKVPVCPSADLLGSVKEAKEGDCKFCGGCKDAR